MGRLRSRSVLVVVERGEGDQACFEVVCLLLMPTVRRVLQVATFQDNAMVMGSKSPRKELGMKQVGGENMLLCCVHVYHQHWEARRYGPIDGRQAENSTGNGA